MLVKKRLCYSFFPWWKERRGEGWRVEAAGDRCVCIYILPVEVLILSFWLLSLLSESSVNELRIIIFLMWEFVFFLYAGTTAEIQVGLRRWVCYVLLCDATYIPFIDTLYMHVHSIYVNMLLYTTLSPSLSLSSSPLLSSHRSPSSAHLKSRLCLNIHHQPTLTKIPNISSCPTPTAAAYSSLVNPAPRPPFSPFSKAHHITNNHNPFLKTNGI